MDNCILRQELLESLKRPNGRSEWQQKSASFFAVRSSALIMYEASPSAYPSGMLVVEKSG
jgi:hypothetical protein